MFNFGSNGSIFCRKGVLNNDVYHYDNHFSDFKLRDSKFIYGMTNVVLHIGYD